jgi:hypothetical protein
MNRMKCIVSVSLLAALAFAPTSASAANDIVFIKLATDEGCGFYWAISKAVAAEQHKFLHYSWSMPCRKGQLINGPGTLTEDWQKSEKWRDGDSDNTSRFVGTMVEGVFDGPLSWSIGGRRNAGVDSAAMGCFYYKPENHPWYKKCVPRTPTSHSGVSNASASSAAAPQLRPTAKLEAHNPANEASGCLEPIDSTRYKAKGVSSTMGAVFRNICAYPVEARWCLGDRCAHGYDNLATIPASGDRGISYDPPADGSRMRIRWVGCRMGFVHRADFEGTLQYACK